MRMIPPGVVPAQGFSRCKMRGLGLVSKWTPKTPGGLLQWQKADAGIVFGVSPAINTWQDQSGNAKDLTQATTAKQPTLVSSALNGLPVARFSAAAADDLANALSASGLTALTVAWTFKPTGNSVAGAGYWAWQSSAQDGSPFILCAYDTVGGLKVLVNGGYNITGVSQPQGTAASYILTWSGTAWKLYQNSTAAAIASYTGGQINQSRGTGMYLGVGFGGFTGDDYGEFLVYNSALGASDITSLQSYLKGRWGTP